MSFKNLKDQRRSELIIPYIPLDPKAEEQDMAGTLGTALPMAAMFTRHKMIGWTAVVFAIQNWLNETPGSLAAGKQPAFFSVGMAVMSLAITYMSLFFPPGGVPTGGSATGPAAPAEPIVAA
ncbi:hypothetical protein EDC01DRAFT_71792 [Geopyxis carbonaria]|nr:hypothetical protein EDC01DRAFT_71792 [Geopyxis carbonaria]